MAEIKKVGENTFVCNFGKNAIVSCKVVSLYEFALPSTQDLVYGVSNSVSPVSGAPSLSQIHQLCVCGDGVASIVLLHPIQRIHGRGRGREGNTGLSIPRSLRNLVMNHNHTLVGKTISFVRAEFQGFGMKVQENLVEDNLKVFGGLKQDRRSLKDEEIVLELLAQAYWCRKIYLNEKVEKAEKEKKRTDELKD